VVEQELTQVFKRAMQVEQVALVEVEQDKVHLHQLQELLILAVAVAVLELTMAVALTLKQVVQELLFLNTLILEQSQLVLV